MNGFCIIELKYEIFRLINDGAYSENSNFTRSFTGFSEFIDTRIGATIVSCSDDFFAEAKRMLQTGPAKFIESKYDDNGKWMDGWETRRKREAGYDWCVVRLGVTGTVSGFDIDTSFSTEIILHQHQLKDVVPDEQLDQVEWIH